MTFFLIWNCYKWAELLNSLKANNLLSSFKQTCQNSQLLKCIVSLFCKFLISYCKLNTLGFWPVGDLHFSQFLDIV